MVTLEIPTKWFIIILVSIVVVGSASVGTIREKINTVEQERVYFQDLAEKRKREGDSLNLQRMLIQKEYDSIYRDYTRIIDSLELDYKDHLNSKKIITLSDSLWNVYYDQL